jgi:hypothetical protein
VNILKNLNTWSVATAINGREIQVKVVPMLRKQNTINGMIMVDVGNMIELESGEQFPFNLDGKSFYTGFNQLYRLS